MSIFKRKKHRCFFKFEWCDHMGWLIWQCACGKRCMKHWQEFWID